MGKNEHSLIAPFHKHEVLEVLIKAASAWSMLGYLLPDVCVPYLI